MQNLLKSVGGSLNHGLLKPRRVRGLTMVEMLIVIAIIALLGGLIIPTVNNVLMKAEASRSVSNLRQIGLASISFAIENNGFIPNDQGSSYPQPVAMLVNGSMTTSYNWRQGLSAYLNERDGGDRYSDDSTGIFTAPRNEKTIGFDPNAPGRLGYGMILTWRGSGTHQSLGVVRMGAAGNRYLKPRFLPHPSQTMLYVEASREGMDTSNLNNPDRNFHSLKPRFNGRVHYATAAGGVEVSTVDELQDLWDSGSSFSITNEKHNRVFRGL